MSKIFPCLAAAVAVVGNANALTITGSTTGGRSAEADISLSGSGVNTVLNIDLKNTGAAAHVPTDVLLGLFFNLPSVTITSGSAALHAGDTVSYGSIVNNVGEGWAYANGLHQYGANSGISASGLGLFGAGNLYSTHVGASVGGLDYGIANGFNNPNAGTQHGPIISNEIDFTLHLSGNVDLATLSRSLTFQWGTALDEGNAPGIPQVSLVPDASSTLLLLGTALSWIELIRRRRS